MKKFISENWFKLMVGPSLLMASFGFMMYSINPASAKSLDNAPANSKYILTPVNSDGTISVKFSEEQLSKIVPKNEDGSINIKLSEKQLKAITPNAVQDVNLAQLNGWEPDVRSYGQSKRVSLAVTVMNEY